PFARTTTPSYTATIRDDAACVDDKVKSPARESSIGLSGNTSFSARIVPRACGEASAPVTVPLKATEAKATLGGSGPSHGSTSAKSVQVPLTASCSPRIPLTSTRECGNSIQELPRLTLPAAES